MKVEPRRDYGADRRTAERAFAARLQSDSDARECLIPFSRNNGSVAAFVDCYQSRKAARAARRT